MMNNLLRQVALNEQTIDKQQEQSLQSEQLRATVLLGTLKEQIEESTTYKTCQSLAEKMPQVEFDYQHLATMDIAYGVQHDKPEDDMVKIVQSIKQSDIVLIASPIWWGQPSSLIQKVIERMDSLDLRYDEEKRSIGEGRVLGTVITGAEDGSQGCIQRICGWAPLLGFTVCPYSNITWLDTYKDSDDPDSYRNTASHMEFFDRTLELTGKTLVKHAKMIKKMEFDDA